MGDKIAIITGASRGIGREAALELAKNGYSLIITCKENTSMLLKVKNLVSMYNVNCLAFTGDLSDYNIVLEFFHFIKFHEVKNIDLLINNMGIAHIGLLQDLDINTWHKVLDTNLTAAFSLCKHTIPYMLNQKSGKIINISSIWGESGASCEVAYSASKGGLNTFTKALAKELAPSNIQVNAISCGAIDTEMNNHLSDDEKTDLADGIPMSRFASPKEVAAMIVLLANAPAYLTGKIIGFDGGGFS